MYASGGIDGVVPRVVLASSGSATVVCAMIYGEIKRYSAVATCRVTDGVCRRVGIGIVGVVVPIETVTGNNGFDSCVTVVYCKVQGVRA